MKAQSIQNVFYDYMALRLTNHRDSNQQAMELGKIALALPSADARDLSYKFKILENEILHCSGLQNEVRYYLLELLSVLNQSLITENYPPSDRSITTRH